MVTRTTGHRRELPSPEVSPRDELYVRAKKIVRIGDDSFANDCFESDAFPGKAHHGDSRVQAGPVRLPGMGNGQDAGEGEGHVKFYNPLWDDEADEEMRPPTPPARGPALSLHQLPRSRESLNISEPSTSSASSSASARPRTPVHMSQIVSEPIIEPLRPGKIPLGGMSGGRRSFPDEHVEGDEDVLLNDLIAPPQRRADKGKAPMVVDDSMLPGGMGPGDEEAAEEVTMGMVDRKGKGVMMVARADLPGPSFASSSSASASSSSSRPPAARTLALALDLPRHRSPWACAPPPLDDARPTTAAITAMLAMEEEERETRLAMEDRVLSTQQEAAVVADPTGGRPRTAPAYTAGPPARLGGASAMRMMVRRYKGAVGKDGPPAYVGYIHVPFAAVAGAPAGEHVIALEGRRLKWTSNTNHITLRAEAGGAASGAPAPAPAPLWTGRLRGRRASTLFTLLEDSVATPALGIPAASPARRPKHPKGGALPGGHLHPATGPVVGGAVEGIPLFVPQPAPAPAAPPFAPRAVAPSPSAPSLADDPPSDDENDDGARSPEASSAARRAAAVDATASGDGVTASHVAEVVDMDACMGRSSSASPSSSSSASARKVDLGRKVMRVGFRSTSLLGRAGPRNMYVEPLATSPAPFPGAPGKGGSHAKVAPSGKGGASGSGGASPAAPALSTRRAVWDPSSKAYVLDFGGAGYQPSVKNMQLVASSPTPPAARMCAVQRTRRALRIGGSSCCDHPAAGSSRCSRPGSAAQVAVAGTGALGNSAQEPLALQMGRRSQDTFEVIFGGGPGGVNAAQAFAIAVANLEGSNYFVS